MIDMPPPVRDPLCPICHKALFGRVVWFKTTGNCHDTCVEQLVLDDIAAQRAEEVTEPG